MQNKLLTYSTQSLVLYGISLVGMVTVVIKNKTFLCFIMIAVVFDNGNSK